MKIKDLNLERRTDRIRISANIGWEDCDRAAQEVYIETEPAFAPDIFPDPHAFVIAALFPALYFGEKRLHIDESVCPRLLSGLNTAMRLLLHWWYPPDHKIVAIEAKKLETVPQGTAPKRAAFCFSGGVDSMATLYRNHLEYPVGHPGYITDGLLVCGLEVQDVAQFQKVTRLIGAIAEVSGVTFIPAYTNIVELGPENQNEYWKNFWIPQYMSAAFAAIAHAFSMRWHCFSVNASHDIPNLVPHGSNPLLAPCYSSWGLQIYEEGIDFSRFEKIKLIARWEPALQNLRVCNESHLYRDVHLNCGNCEKCVRTMLALEAVGGLDRSDAFAVNSVRAGLVDQAVEIAENTLPLYMELIKPLSEVGRQDLAEAVQLKISAYQRKMKRERLQHPIIEFDKKYFNGAIKKIKNFLMENRPFDRR